MKLKNPIDHSKRFWTVLGQKVSHYWTHLKKKGLRYWLTVFLLLGIGTAAGELLGRYHAWIHFRYQIYKKLQDVGTLTRKERRTVLVLISDDDFWRGPLERRLPLKRDYLAGLVEELAKGEPSVIALDCDFRSPIPKQGATDLAGYEEENNKLRETINKVSEKRKIVLATSITYDGTGYVLDPNIFDGYGFDPQRVLHGYAKLPIDSRRVPLSMPVKNGTTPEENSFASAIARTRDQDLIRHVESDGELPYGHFSPPEDFQKITAGEALGMGEAALREKIQGRVVIIGGAWHTGSYRGTDEITNDSVDLHYTPVGNIQGAYLHANYVEALLGGGVRRGLSEPVAIMIEVICSLMVAISFALEGSLARKFGRLFVVCGGVIGLSYLLWQNFGMFFDFVIPIVLLSAHGPIEEFRETRAEVRRLRKQLHQSGNARLQPQAPITQESEEAVISTGQVFQ
jgi:CHASE2 domain-containing sensor protein